MSPKSRWVGDIYVDFVGDAFGISQGDYTISQELCGEFRINLSTYNNGAY